MTEAVPEQATQTLAEGLAPAGQRSWRRLFYERFEIAWTLLLDGGLVGFAIVVRWLLLLALARLSPQPASTWAVRLLEWILEFGMVGTAAIITVFDLLKRVVNAYKGLRKEAERE